MNSVEDNSLGPSDYCQNTESPYGSAVRVFDTWIQAETIEQALDRVDRAIVSRERCHIGVVNAAKIVNMRRDPELKHAVHASDAIYADGMSVVWASRLLGQSLPERVAGIDLMHGILRRGQDTGYRIFCLGATPEVLKKVVNEFNDLYAGIVIAGQRDGYFGVEEEESVAEDIRNSKADVLFVAITSPKKEQFMSRWATKMNVPVVHGVGGSFDVVAGVVERAPESWRRLGLEWLYRVKQEPRRLWRRYLTTNAAFVWLLIRSMSVRAVRPVTNRRTRQ